MRRLMGAAALALAALAPDAWAAQTRDQARPRDLQRLQEDLANLDDELAALPERESEAGRLRERAEELREDVIYLKVKMRRHQREGGAGTGLTYEEVAEVRRAVADLREDVAGTTSRDQAEVRVPAGTELLLRLEEPLSSRTARREDRVEASLLSPVRVDRTVALPAGSRALGVVRQAEPAERPSRGGRLELDFDTVYLDRQRLEMRGRVVSLQERVEDTRARKAGLGAVLGGVLGTIVGGRKGALLGVIIGGTGAVVASRGEELELPEGTVLVLRLERDLVVPRQ